MTVLTKRERAVLIPAVLYRWSVEYDRSGYAKWEGDTTLPFRAHKTLEGLVGKRLMEHVGCNQARATTAAYDYACRAAGCFRGRLYDEDTEVGKCSACDGTGLTLSPPASPPTLEPSNE